MFSRGMRSCLGGLPVWISHSDSRGYTFFPCLRRGIWVSIRFLGVLLSIGLAPYHPFKGGVKPRYFARGNGIETRAFLDKWACSANFANNMWHRTPWLFISLLTALLFPLPAVQAGDFSVSPEGLDTPESVMALSAGYITPDTPVEGTILEDSTDTQLIIGSRRTLFLRMVNFDNLAPGDLFTVYRRIHQVFHPAHGQYLGWLVSVRGIVQVTKIDLDIGIVTVKVVRAFDAMTPGDAVMRYVPPLPAEEPSPSRIVPEKPSIVVELWTRQSLVGQRNVVYLDWGKREGVVRGDHLDIFRPKLGRPLRWVGEVRVLSAQDHTATAMIVKSPVNIFRGDILILKEPPKPQAQVEEELKPLENEITGIEVKREGEKLIITLVDQVLFDSGYAEIKPGGREILLRVSEILRGASDQKILVEGHTDNVRIGPSLKKTFPSNWELSRARANNVRAYLSEQGGIEANRISAAEYADTRPVASNSTDEGRQKNRRVEIILMPKEEASGAIPAAAELPTVTANQPSEQRIPATIPAMREEPMLSAPDPSSSLVPPVVEPPTIPDR